MATDWRKGDEINPVLEGNFDGLRTPNNWVIEEITQDGNNGKDVYTIQHMVTRQEQIVSVNELNQYFRLVRHTR